MPGGELCSMGYPSLGLGCIRPKGHSQGLDCFAKTEHEGKMWGVFLHQDGNDWTDNPKHWPSDLAEATPKNAASTGRRAAIEAQKARKNAQT
ncbi:hypothetical protein LCGC14_0244310 [marine sediment metagenome]|uniref:Uncharacterized protein n=1 Tax=marine sediment metagenome TaxID=412755 RepID=A0A0F9UB27_9ZZZZ